MYELEIYLVEDFENILTSPENPFDITEIASEFNYNNGKVDIIAMTNCGELITFEAKLIRWRNALNQAYRNSSFAHYSYVVLPETVTKNALKKRHEFDRRGIGLCSVDPSGMNIEIPASKKNPLQPWLTESAFEYIAKD